MIAMLKRSAVLLVAAAICSATGLAQSARENAADADRLIRALDIRPGSAVGEVGAGAGELTIAMARAVGDSGRIFTNTVVDGRAAETNFPDQCCDAIFMRNVYHHFGDPAAMNASLFKSLKDGGRLAVIDFTPPPGPGGEAAPGGRAEDNHHGITAPTLERELKAAGFEIVSSETRDRGVFVVAAKRAGGTR
jgi:ubiquinone/menaquinone biosynthesis C-methylase UbiE